MRGLWLSAVIVALALGLLLVAPPSAVQAAKDKGVTLSVPATQAPPGVATGILLQPGDKIKVRASGLATYGYQGAECIGFPQTDPEGNRYLDGSTCPLKIDPQVVLPTAPVGALLGRIGDGPWFAIGKKENEKIDRSGQLFLLYNEVIWYDNAGGYEVTVDVKSKKQ